ncbi:MAG: methylmalonyl-CoA mutase family protein [Promethearchaeota archaeon]
MEENRLREELEKWESGPFARSFDKVGTPLPKLTTSSGIALKPLYTPLDAPRDPATHLEKLGFPGKFPFTRGAYPSMYLGRTWTMRQYAGFGSAQQTNRRFHYLLEAGQTGLSVAFDLPTQMGLDSDHPLAEGEVGRVGVPVNHLGDLEALFAGIPLERVSVSFTINATAPYLLAAFVVLAERAGVEASALRCTLQNDVLKEYVARGTYVFPPRPSLRLCVDVVDYCRQNLPKFNPISVSGYHLREAGCTAPQEVGFTLSNAVEYVRAVKARGVDVDQFAGRLSFFFCAQNDFFEEVAKFRAARRLWARVAGEWLGAKRESSRVLRFHAQTAGVTLASVEPENNAVRVAYQALAAVLGGAQSLHTNSLDEALSLPSEETVRLALRTQQILAQETGVANVVDPLGGSFFVEALTDAVEQEATRVMERVEGVGGALAAIEKGLVQGEVQANAYRIQRKIEAGILRVVGVNFPPAAATSAAASRGVRPFKFDARGAAATLESLKRWKEAREGSAVEDALEEVKKAARVGENVIPSLIEAVRAGATNGEACDALREVFGVHEPNRSF